MTLRLKSPALAFICNMLLAYAVCFVCRLAYLFENWPVLSQGISWAALPNIVKGSLLFDTSALLYTNVLYALLMLLPCHLRESRAWQSVAKWMFVAVNSLCAFINLGDAVYFKFTGRRTTCSVFQEFSNEGNIISIFADEIVNHWYLVLLGIAIAALLSLAYVRPSAFSRPQSRLAWFRYYALAVIAFVIYIPLMIGGMRGGLTTATRPITISNANQYVNRPADAALVLNTPFALIRTISKKSFSDPQYFAREELDDIYTPLHVPADSASFSPRNVVVLIVESFGREYIGAYNERLEGGAYKGYAPFVDSLYSRSLSFDYTFCNGRKSIDGMPSVLCGIPMFVEPFFLTPASMNRVGGLARSLGDKGYETAFFHGAQNGSMGFQAFARSSGFGAYYGRTEYDADSRFGGEDDFDGTWAIWDEPFLQFYAAKMSEMKQPFMTAVFTASSHHPFVVPEAYRDTFPDDGVNVIHKCIRYTDHSLRRFFQTASRQPWFKNTVFVFTSDHTNISDHAEYQTDLGSFGAPILFFDPSGELFEPGRRHCIAQQIDIMPSILGLLGYDEPYVSFGKNLFATPDSATWAVNYNNGIYQYVKGDYLLQFDGKAPRAVYNIKTDWLLTDNILGQVPEQDDMLRSLKAVIQQYMERMIEDRIVP